MFCDFRPIRLMLKKNLTQFSLVIIEIYVFWKWKKKFKFNSFERVKLKFVYPNNFLLLKCNNSIIGIKIYINEIYLIEKNNLFMFSQYFINLLAGFHPSIKNATDCARGII